MSGGAGLAVAVTVVALAALLWLDRAGRPAAAGVAKLVASTGFVALAWVVGAPESEVGRGLLAALGLCWIGDALLIPRGARGLFLGGLASFLMAHVVFAAAFAALGLDGRWSGTAGLAFVAAAVAIVRWLSPHVHGVMRLAVLAYVVAIGWLVVFAAGATGAVGDGRLLTGAVLFAVSDLFVARERFVEASPSNRLLGLPLYYAATLLLASAAAPRVPNPLHLALP